ncbi:M81 family metallopeptidase [Paraburkholderia fungorum]|uniref:M81 family metallopeptidase n=1 Tax=Paraburkholderia fungorum TaxID=134537 RepID=UPI001C1E9DF5|nr:M81 family metallopeptidase [Paraburkholderia fungorum]MBU7442325.1 M81 family metallopeptidase [Paraburkholderia fungorum]
MRVFVASLVTETNTFSPFPTSYEDFIVHERGSASDSMLGVVPKVFRNRAEADGHTVIESITAYAEPSGRTVKTAYERLRDTIVGDLKSAGPVDMLLLMLHGAMVAQGYDDCEGDILTRLREIADNAVIGVVIDPHCHLTETMVEKSDLMIIAKEYPHIDFADRAHEVYDICQKVSKGEVTLTGALKDTRIVGFYPTFDSPMRDIVNELTEVEKRPSILSASIGHGFPWADVEDVGTRVLVYANDDAREAARVAANIAERLYEARAALRPNYPSIAESLDRAIAMSGQIVLGDFADNPGCGASGDSTFFLKAMLECNVTDAVIGAFWDPLVAKVCASAGVGATLNIRLGGKCGPASSDPVDLKVEVMGVVDNHSGGAWGGRIPMGLSVWLRAGGIDIAVCSIRTQLFERDSLTGLGINLDRKRIIVVKSSNHYQTGFRPGSDALWHVNSPGALPSDFSTLPYTKRDMNYYPRSPDPWAEYGMPPAILFGGKRAIAN